MPIRCLGKLLLKPDLFLTRELNTFSFFPLSREHYDLPPVFNNDSTFNEMRDYALATLLYGELLIFSSKRYLLLLIGAVGRKF